MIKKTRCECPECKFESDMIPYHTVIFCRLECTLPTHFFLATLTLSSVFSPQSL